MAGNPDIGEQKKGDLARLRIYKFRISGQLYLLGYTRDDAVRLLYPEVALNIGAPTIKGRYM